MTGLPLHSLLSHLLVHSLPQRADLPHELRPELLLRHAVHALQLLLVRHWTHQRHEVATREDGGQDVAHAVLVRRARAGHGLQRLLQVLTRSDGGAGRVLQLQREVAQHPEEVGEVSGQQRQVLRLRGRGGGGGGGGLLSSPFGGWSRLLLFDADSLRHLHDELQLLQRLLVDVGE